MRLFRFYLYTILVLAPTLGVAANAPFEVLQVERLFSDKKEQLKLGDLPGVSVVMFWASWCEFCKDFSRSVTASSAGGRVKVIGISVDEDRSEGQNAGRTTYRFIPDHFWIGPQNKVYSPKILPVVLLLNGGRVDTIYEGSQSDKQGYFRKRVRYLLGEQISAE